MKKGHLPYGHKLMQIMFDTLKRLHNILIEVLNTLIDNNVVKGPRVE